MNSDYSIYKSLKHRKDNVKNLGYDYRGNIMKNSISNIIKNSNNQTLQDILKLIDSCLDFMIVGVKTIKSRVNICVDKDTDLIN